MRCAFRLKAPVDESEDVAVGSGETAGSGEGEAEAGSASRRGAVPELSLAAKAGTHASTSSSAMMSVRILKYPFHSPNGCAGGIVSLSTKRVAVCHAAS